MYLEQGMFNMSLDYPLPGSMEVLTVHGELAQICSCKGSCSPNLGHVKCQKKITMLTSE